MEPLISIIVPVYNVEKYINRCLESILKQSYKNIEVLLINDGSQDNSAKICEDIAALDSRIKVIHQDNKGVSSARNKGLDISKGEYITFIDSDDWVDRDGIECLYRNLKKTESDLAIYSFIQEYENKKNINVKLTESIEVMNREDTIKFIFNDNRCQGFIWNKLYKSKIINSEMKKIRFNEKITVLEDLYFNIEYMIRCNKAVYIDSQKYHYYISGNSAMFSIFNEKKITSLKALDAISELLEGNNELENLVKGHYVVTNLLLLTNIYDSNYCNNYLENEICKNIKDNKRYFKNYNNSTIKQKLGFYLFNINYKIFKNFVKLFHKKKF